MLAVRVLGPVEVTVGDTRVDLGGALPRRLLAALVAAGGQVVSDDRLAELVWGANPPARSAATLQVYVSRLRRALGPDGRDTLERDGTGYRFRVDPTAVDASQFAALVDASRKVPPADAVRGFTEALAMWRGEPFADLVESDEVGAARTRLLELREVALEECAAARLASGDATGAVPDLEELVKAAPLRERRWALLVLALYRSGRQADALAAVRRARALLSEELGVDLGPELQELERQVLTQDPELREAPTARATGRPLTSFLGRENERRMIAEQFATQRLVSLIGPTGVGKTRLALEYADTPWFARLAAVRQPTELPSVVADAIGLVAVQDDPIAAMIRTIGDRPHLLVLDNCEHIVAEAAELAIKLLSHCPHLRILATSREPLGVDGEVTIAVDPLPPSIADALLIDRVRTVLPGWNPTVEELGQTRRISIALDGLPLAIELAAARARMFGLAEIAERLNDRFALLGPVPRGSLAAHATLQAAIGWSVDLLSKEEHALLLRLWPFEGGFTLTAADAVRPADNIDPVLETLSSLVTKSVVVADTSVLPTRYLLLESVRAYGESIDPDPADARQAHARWVRGLADQCVTEVRTKPADQFMRMLTTELPNIRAGLTYELVRDPVVALHTFGQFALFFTRCVNKVEAIALVRDLLQAAPHAPAFDRCRAYNTLVALTAIGGSRAEGRLALRSAMELLPEVDERTDPLDLAELYYNLCFCAAEVGVPEIAIPIAERGIAFATEHGMGALAHAIQTGRTVAFAVQAFAAGDTPAMVDAARAAYRPAGRSYTSGWASLVFGEVLLRVGDEDVDEALTALRHALTILTRERDIPNILTALYFGALALARSGRGADAVRLHAAIQQHAAQTGNQPTAMFDEGTHWLDEEIDAVLEPDEWDKARADGAGLSWTDMIAILA